MSFGLPKKQSWFLIGIIFLSSLITPTIVWGLQIASTDAKSAAEKNKSDPEETTITAQKQKLETETNAVFNQINTTDASILIGRLINGAMGILGSLALVMFVYGGFLWMTAAGEEAKSEKARTVVLWATLGIAVIFASYAILKLVFEAFI